MNNFINFVIWDKLRIKYFLSLPLVSEGNFLHLYAFFGIAILKAIFFSFLFVYNPFLKIFDNFRFVENFFSSNIIIFDIFQLLLIYLLESEIKKPKKVYLFFVHWSINRMITFYHISHIQTNTHHLFHIHFLFAFYAQMKWKHLLRDSLMRKLLAAQKASLFEFLKTEKK